MSVNTTEIGTVYDFYIARFKATLDTELSDGKIQGDLYAKALVSLMQQTMQLATQTVQQQPILDAQREKTEADVSFVGTQETELSNSVTFNNKIKALDAYGDMIGTMGAGSLVVSADMWSKFFDMVQGLNTDGTAPSNTTVTKLT